MEIISNKTADELIRGICAEDRDRECESSDDRGTAVIAVWAFAGMAGVIVFALWAVLR